MAVPGLFGDTLADYRVAFTVTAGVLYLVLGWIAAHMALLIGTASVETTWRRLIAMALAIGPLLGQRFDLLVATLVAGALLAVGWRRDRTAGVLFGLGS